MEEMLLQATIYLLAAVVAVPLATRLGLGSVLGYLLAGIAIGFVPGIGGHAAEELRHVAEFGVVMMLFLIGLELDPRALWSMRRQLVGLGGLQIGVTAVLVGLAAALLGLPPSQAAAVGLILALSSTAIVLQTLQEKDLMRSEGGRGSFSVLLAQDIAVIPMLALIPLLAIPRYEEAETYGISDGLAAGFSLVEDLPAWGVTLATVGAIGAVILIGIYVIPRAFAFIERTRLREMYTAFALLIVVGIATLMNLAGLSPALGAFVAGVVLAGSEFRHELEGDIEPFKGLFLGLFFITVGAGIDFGAFFAEPLLVLGLAAGLIVLKASVLYALATVFGLASRARLLFTLSLAQAGEFGFVLIAFSERQDVIGHALAERLLLVVALSMLITPLLFIAYEAVKHRFGEGGVDPEPDFIDETQPVIIAGIGRFGQGVNRLLKSAGFRTVVLDSKLEAVQLMRSFGVKGFFGDPTRPDILHAAGLAEAKVLVVALDDREKAVKLVAYARRERPDLHIVARARDRVHVYELFQAGADNIVRELFDSSLRAGRYALEALGLTDYEAYETERAFFRMDRRVLRELAEHWDPSVPVGANSAYVEKSRELNAQMEIELVARLDEGRREWAQRTPEELAADKGRYRGAGPGRDKG